MEGKALRNEKNMMTDLEKIDKRCKKSGLFFPDLLLRREISIEEFLDCICELFKAPPFKLNECPEIIIDTGFRMLNHPNKIRDVELKAMTLFEYEKSPEWRNKSKLLRKKYNRCQLCGECGTLHVHHNNYENIPYEELIDLIVLCESCHENYHLQKREIKQYAQNILSWNSNTCV